MDTNILYYKRYENQAQTSDYVAWAIQMVEQNYTSNVLYMLASIQPPLNAFEVEEFFQRTLKELDLLEPTHEQCAKAYLKLLIEKITDKTEHNFDIVYKIDHILVDYPFEELLIWNDISDKIGDYQYGDNRNKYTKDGLSFDIMNEANKQIKEWKS